jgi:hypothetical protein
MSADLQEISLILQGMKKFLKHEQLQLNVRTRQRNKVKYKVLFVVAKSWIITPRHFKYSIQVEGDEVKCKHGDPGSWGEETKMSMCDPDCFAKLAQIIWANYNEKVTKFMEGAKELAPIPMES